MNRQRKNCLYRDEKGRDVEGVEEDLSGNIPVSARVERCLCEEHWMLL
jgi:hypothetical protein